VATEKNSFEIGNYHHITASPELDIKATIIQPSSFIHQQLLSILVSHIFFDLHSSIDFQ
jgi:hypothetical protein